MCGTQHRAREECKNLHEVLFSGLQINYWEKAEQKPLWEKQNKTRET